MTDRLTPAELAEAARLAEAATEGPWEVRREEFDRDDEEDYEQAVRGFGPYGYVEHDALSELSLGEAESIRREEADAAFIAASRTLVPRLLAEVAALREELEALKAIHSRCHTIPHTSTEKDRAARARKRRCFWDRSQAPTHICCECRAFNECINPERPVVATLDDVEAGTKLGPIPLDEVLP